MINLFVSPNAPRVKPSKNEKPEKHPASQSAAKKTEPQAFVDAQSKPLSA